MKPLRGFQRCVQKKTILILNLAMWQSFSVKKTSLKYPHIHLPIPCSWFWEKETGRGSLLPLLLSPILGWALLGVSATDPCYCFPISSSLPRAKLVEEEVKHRHSVHIHMCVDILLGVGSSFGVRGKEDVFISISCYPKVLCLEHKYRTPETPENKHHLLFQASHSPPSSSLHATI